MHWTVRNINGAFYRMLRSLLGITNHARHVSGEDAGHEIQPVAWVKQDSRNGPVLRLDEPLTITYTRPWERILWNPVRKCNPFFHLAESLWMICGRRDVKTLDRYNRRMIDFSDNGVIFHGAYGYRLQSIFNPINQITTAVEILRKDPTTRRVVLSMWSPVLDLGEGSRDIPCNTTIYLQVMPDPRGCPDVPCLDMTICNRSNDIMWGMLGANPFHFSYLQQFLATAIGVQMGRLHQFSTNAHLYTDMWPQEKLQAMFDAMIKPGSLEKYTAEPCYIDHYPELEERSRYDVVPMGGPLFVLHPQCDHRTAIKRMIEYQQMVSHFLDEPCLDSPKIPTRFDLVEAICLEAWEHHRIRNYIRAQEIMHDCCQSDLRLACKEWLKDTEAKYINKQQRRSDVQEKSGAITGE